MNEEILKKLGYNNIALEMLLKREAQISPEDIIMPGEDRNVNNRNINTGNDDQAVEISLENIQQQYITLVNTIKSLPDEHDGDDYFRKLKNNLYRSTFEVGVKLGSIMTQAGMDTSGLDDFLND
jgi:hypothetical protein